MKRRSSSRKAVYETSPIKRRRSPEAAEAGVYETSPMRREVRTPIKGGKRRCMQCTGSVALAKLMLPGTTVAGELMNEHDRSARPDFFIIELHAIIGGELGHSNLPG